MSLQRVYGQLPEKATDVRAYLEKNAGQFGLTSDSIKGMKNPVVVRVVDDIQKKDMKKLVRQFNESFTQGMDPRTLQVALAGKVDSKVLGSLTSIMRDDDTLNSALSRRDSLPLIRSLKTSAHPA